MNVLVLAVAILVGVVASAEAVNPACGQTIAGSWTLTSDMDCRLWNTHGVDLDDFASLNCNGFLIWGPDLAQPNGTATGRYGIRVNDKQHVTVTNCKVKGYERGLNVSGSMAVTVSGGNYKQNTKYGINVGLDSSAVTIEGLSANLNGDEGLHAGGPFLGEILIQNVTVQQNWQEGVYLHRANGVILRDSTIIDNSQDPNGSHPDLNLDESTDLVVSNVKIGNQVRVIAQPQESFSLCASSIPNACQ